MKALEAEITDEFKAYVAAWAGKVVREEIHEANFPDSVSKDQRKVRDAHAGNGISWLTPLGTHPPKLTPEGVAPCSCSTKLKCILFVLFDGH